MGSVSYPTAQFNEILPDLFQGGHVWEEGFRRYCEADLTGTSFDLVVSHYVDHYNKLSWPKSGKHIILEFYDNDEAMESSVLQDKLASLSTDLSKSYLDGQKILVRCQAGYNRSGLVMALTLLRLGFNSTQAINMLRQRRSIHVLMNPHFEEYVREYEGLFYNPFALETTLEVVCKKSSAREDKEIWDHLSNSVKESK